MTTIKKSARRLALICGVSALLLLTHPAFASEETSVTTLDPTSENGESGFSAEFAAEGAYVSEGDVEGEGRSIDNFDETNVLLRFIFTPRVFIGILRLGGEWELYNFGFSRGETLPGTLQSAAAIVGLDTKYSDSLLFRIEAQPGVYGTDDFDSNNFNVPFLIGGTYIFDSGLQIVAGVGVNFDRNYPVIPGGGIRWKFASRWLLNAVVPTPRIEYKMNNDFMLYAGANLKGNTYRVGKNFGNTRGDDRLSRAVLSYAEIRTGAGFEWKLSDPLTLAVEGGFLPYREFDFHRVDVRYKSDGGAFYGMIALRGEF